MKNLTKKLFLSMLTVAFAVVALGTTTFAWFTLSTDAKIDAFGAQVSGGEGFEIQVTSADGSSYQSPWYSGLVPSTAIDDAITNTFTKFDANTPTLASIDQPELLFHTVKIEGGRASLVEAKEGSHVTFKLNFKLTDKAFADKYKLILSSFIFDTDTTTYNDWTCDATFGNYVPNNKLQLFVEDSARMRIYSAAAKPIYENTQGAHTQVTDKSQTGAVIANTTGISTSGFAAKYWIAKTNIDALPEILNDYKSVKVAADDTSFGDLGAEGLTLTIDIWIEGYDNECMNAIFAQTLKTTLSFKLVGKAQE